MTKKRREKSRKPARLQERFQDRRPIVLIVCEGENTEPAYFEGLRAKESNPRVRIRTLEGQGVPLTIARTARDEKEKAEAKAKKQGDEFLAYESVWCVFDRDDHPHIPEAIELASTHGLRIAFSNPCFELWLLLHFREQPGNKHRDAVISLLRDELPKYQKRRGSLEIKAFLDGYPEAVRRASRLCSARDEQPLWDRNPYTNVHELTELITSPNPEPPAEPDSDT